MKYRENAFLPSQKLKKIICIVTFKNMALSEVAADEARKCRGTSFRLSGVVCVTLDATPLQWKIGHRTARTLRYGKL